MSQHENEGQDKHVESVWFPCLDEGSTPSSSTSAVWTPSSSTIKQLLMDWMNIGATVLLVIIGIAIYVNKRKNSVEE